MLGFFALLEMYCQLPIQCKVSYVKRPGNIDELVEGDSFFIDANQEKAEDYLLGKGLLYKFGRKPYVQDVECHATYNMSNLPITRSDSIFTTFESDIKQLVTVCIRSEF
ncbi:hypothetical protein RJT34_24937 [Clitoria ternatea]|uniref:Uncharacterized protein n=1 Tax=Clitoria ternatea TaxID=43366 RepID=A0AAN9IGE0_CLITE